MLPLYRVAPERMQTQLVSEPVPRVTISADSQPLSLFVRQIAEQTGVSIVVEEAIELKTVSLEVADQSVEDVIAMVGRRLGTQVTRTGDLYFVGTLRPEDRGVYVASVGQVSPDDMRQIAGLLLSEHGRASVTERGLVVVGDKVEVLSRIAEAVDEVKDATREVWLVQMHVIKTQQSVADSLGINADAALSGTASTIPGVSVLEGRLTASLEAIRADSKSEVVAEPMYFLGDGTTVTYRRGQRVPIVERVTTELSESSQVRYQEVGLRVELTIRSLGGEDATIRIDLADEFVTDGAEAPIIDGVQYTSETDIVSGQTYLLATLESVSDASRKWSRFGWGRSKSNSRDVTQVWLRVHRVHKEGLVSGGSFREVVDDPERSGFSEHGSTDDATVSEPQLWGDV